MVIDNVVNSVTKCSFRQTTCRRSVNLFLLLRTLAALVIGLILIDTPTISALSIKNENNALVYLAEFGYLNKLSGNSSSLLSEDVLEKAIADFQSFGGINITGQLDDETIKLMNTPRCGVKDKVGYASGSRSKRYALQGSRWRIKQLTWRISKYPRTMDKETVDDEMQRAFDVWTTHTDLKFIQKTSGQVHIEVRFERGEHGDGDPFDGPGGTLAHAYFPVYGGDVHLDDEERWTAKTYKGTNLFQVAAHEIGHSLGLSHSDVKSALMAPFYRGYQPHFQLDSDDVEGIQALYGKKTKGSEPSASGKKATTEVPSATGEDSILCNEAKIDAMFNTAEGATYVFKNDKYWRLTSDGIAQGYPKLISKSWIGLPNNINTAFTYKNGKTYFFKGSQYWRYNGKVKDGEYPKQISEGFAGIPNDLDASLVWSGNGKIYFFKGSKFWRFDPAQKPPVKSTYPKPISNWEGVPDGIDAALQYTNGYTYFFRKGVYYRFNDRNFAIDTADPAFPRSAGYWWFGCRSASKGTILQETKYDPDDDHVDGDLMLDAGKRHFLRQDPSFWRRVWG